MKKIREMTEKFAFCLEYVAFRLLAIVIENLPIRTAYFVAECAGTLAYFFCKRMRRQIYGNVEKVEKVFPIQIPWNKKEFARRVFVHFCAASMELFLARRLMFRHNWRDYITGEGVEFFSKGLAADQCGVICSGHLGPFTISPDCVTWQKFPVYLVVRVQKNPLLMDYFMRLLERAGMKMVPKDKAYAFFQELLQNRRGFPTVLVDQHAGRDALHVDFMGVKAYTAAGAAALVRNYNVPLYIACLLRDGPFQFHFYAVRAELPAFTDDKQADLEKITGIINRQMEKYIQIHPEQWIWMHRRWRDY